MCLDDVLAFRYFNKKEDFQHLSNMNYFNRLGYACESCAVENYRNQDVQILKSFLGQIQGEIHKIENNTVHNCCVCISEIKEDIRSLKSLFNNFHNDRQFWLDENKKLKNELEELKKKRVENCNEKEKTLNISVTLTGARDLNVNISAKRESDLSFKSDKSEKVSLEITFAQEKCEKEVKKIDKEVKVAEVKKSELVSNSEQSDAKHSVKTVRKIWLNNGKQKVENLSSNLNESKLKVGEKPTIDKKRIYKSDFLTNVKPKVKEIVNHYNNELRIISEADISRKSTNLEKVRVPGLGYRLVHPEIKMFQRQEKIRNVWVSENRLIGNRSSLKSK